MSWFVGAFGNLADWRATVVRLATFHYALLEDRPPTDPSATAAAGTMPGPEAALWVRRLVLQPPGSRTRRALPGLELRAAEWLLVSGPSGSGKSSLPPALAGL